MPARPLTLAEVKKEHYNDPVNEEKYMKVPPPVSPKPKKKKGSEGSSRSGSREASGRPKKSKCMTPSLQKKPSGQGM